MLEEIQRKDQNPPWHPGPCRVDSVQVVVDHRELGLVAEGRLSDPRLGSCRQVAVVTPLVAEVGRQVVVVTPLVAMVGHAEVVVDPSVAVVGRVVVDHLVVVAGLVAGRRLNNPQAEVNQ